MSRPNGFSQEWIPFLFFGVIAGVMFLALTIYIEAAPLAFAVAGMTMITCSLFSRKSRVVSSETFRRFYYSSKPYLPKTLRMSVRRLVARKIRRESAGVWPIDSRAGCKPSHWPGWPDGKQFAIALSHDVEGTAGLERTLDLMRLEQELGFTSCFNFVPEREYTVPAGLRRTLESHGFEVGVHDLKHDGKLYSSRENFLRNAERINTYLSDWGAVGFRSAFMLHNLEWLHDLRVLYDSSTFDTDVFEPQPDGVRTIFPFWCGSKESNRGYVEMPYTLPQDSTMFLLLQERSNVIWKRKLEWIVGNGGMAFLNVHPDYIRFSARPELKWQYDPEVYREFLCHVKENYKDAYWHALPRDVAAYYRRCHRARTGAAQSDSEVYVDSYGSSSPVLTLGTLSSFVECTGGEMLSRMVPLLCTV